MKTTFIWVEFLLTLIFFWVRDIWNKVSKSYLTLDERAKVFAFRAHFKVNQLYGNKPYAYHITQVAKNAKDSIAILELDKYGKQIVIAAAWLHDTIEDCRLTYNDISIMFGVDVAEIVYALSNEKGRNRKQRANDKYYSEMSQNKQAVFVKLCDRLANVKESLDNNDSGKLQMARREMPSFLLKTGANNHEEFVNIVGHLSALVGLFSVKQHGTQQYN